MREVTDGYGQVVRCTALALIGRREIHGDAREGVLEAAVADGAADALAGFRERRVGQPDDVAAGLHSPSQPSRSERRRRPFPGYAGGTSPARCPPMLPIEGESGVRSWAGPLGTLLAALKPRST